MRAIWTGSLSFGLINIPVRLYSATNDTGLDLDMLHEKDLSPIRYARFCRAEEKEIPYDEIVKGYEYQPGDYVVLTDDDFKKANIKKTKTIDIIDFVKEDTIDSIYYEKPYYLEPDKNAQKPYALLREAMKKSKKVAVAKFVLRNREHLAAVKFRGNALVLEQMRFDSEIRDPEGLAFPAKSTVKAKEIELALTLIDQLSEPFNIKDYKDTYEEDLKKIIAQKAKGKTPKTRGEKIPQPTTEVANLMDILKKSLEAERGRTRQKEKVR